MKKIFLFLLYLFSLQALYAGDDIAFLDGDKTWTDVEYAIIPDPDYAFTQYSIEPYDSSDDEYLITSTDWTNGDISDSTVAVAGFLKKEGDKIYYSSTDGIYVLAYDFSLSEGDTVYVGSDSLALQADSIVDGKTLDDQVRKYFYLHELDNGGEVVWIEGIGDSRGLLKFEYSPNLEGAGFELVCVSNSSGLIYSNEDYPDCGIEDTYATLLSENKTWKQHDIETYVAGEAYTLQVSGDSVISETTYKIVGDYLLREENGKIYQYYSGDEYLWYDFTVSVGDTIYTGELDEPYFVSEVSDTTIADETLKLIKFNNNSITWIEGIGDTRGLNAVAKAFSMIDCICSSELICCTLDGEVLYNHPDYPNCGVEIYQSIFVENAVWKQYFMEFSNITSINTYQVSGDTVIADVTYKVMDDYLLREENGKVYQYDSGNEYLWYDFTVSVGDTLYTGSMNTVCYVSEVRDTSIAGESLKLIKLNDNSITWIESIGDTRGIDAVGNNELFAYCMCSSVLVCYSIDGEVFYNHPDYPNCGEDEETVSFLDEDKTWTDVKYTIIPDPDYAFTQYSIEPYDSSDDEYLITSTDWTNGDISDSTVTVAGLFKKDGDKIYYSSPYGTYSLAYDFSLSEGDTVYVGNDSLALQVDSIVDGKTLDDQVRKYFYLHELDEGGEVVWIEGIGDTRGVLNFDLEPGLVGVGYELVCVSDSSGLIYSNDEYQDCGTQQVYNTRVIDTTITAGSTIVILIGEISPVSSMIHVEMLKEPDNAVTSEVVYKYADTDESILYAYYNYTSGSSFTGIDTAIMIYDPRPYILQRDSIVIIFHVEKEPQTLILNYTVTNTTLLGSQDGAISISASGGTEPYSYLWSTGDTTSAVSGLTANTYYVTVTDATELSAVDTIIVGVENQGSFTLTGFVYADENTFSDGGVLLYYITDDAVRPLLFAELSSDGSYSFDNLPIGEYMLYAIPNPGVDYVLPTYAYNALVSSDAYILELEGSVTHFNINLICYETTADDGEGGISGTVSVEDSTLISTNMYSTELFSTDKAAGESGNANVPVLLLQDGEIVGWTLTDSYGNYSFDNLSLGTYVIQIEKTGGETIQKEITITEEQTVVEEVDFVITKEGVTSTDIDELSCSISLIPNPAVDEVSVYGVECDIIEIITISGQLQLVSKSSNIINISTLPAGMYVAKISSSKGIFTKLLMIE